MAMQRHNIHAEHGVNAGKLVSQRRKKWRDNVLASRKRKLNDEEEVTDRKFIHEGRRVVELESLAEELWCKKCNRPLSLRNVESEKVIGLAAELHVRCSECETIIQVCTGKSKLDDNFHMRYDMNFKLALGMIDAGLGEMQLNTLLSAMNIHIASKARMKRCEEVVGNKIEKLDKESCRMSVRLERDSAIAAQMSSETLPNVSNQLKFPCEPAASSSNMDTRASGQILNGRHPLRTDSR